MGSTAVLAKLDALIAKYVTLWTSLGTDGLKGASIEGLMRIQAARIDIVQAIISSNEIALHISCAPGTEFDKKMRALAAQSCDSRDVQTLQEWWAKRKMNLG